MELCEHRKDHLNHDKEVGYSKPRDSSVAHGGRHVLGSLVQLCLVLLLLTVILVISSILLLQVLDILHFQLCLGVVDCRFKESKRRSQVFDILLNKLELFDVLRDVVVPLMQQGFETLHVRVRKMDAHSQFSICLDPETILVDLGPEPYFLSL